MSDGAQSMSSATAHNVWCASKPYLALLSGLLHAEGALDLDAPLAELDLGDGWLERRLSELRFSCRDILRHQVSLGQPNGYQAQLLPPWERPRAALDSASGHGEPEYSEFVGWQLLDFAITASSGMPSSVLLSERLFPLVGLTGGRERFANTGSHVGGYWRRASSCDAGVWVLHDRARAVTARDRVAFGLYVSMTELARLYAAVGSAKARCGPVDLQQAVVALQIDESGDGLFSGGFAVNLSKHGFSSSLPPTTFGQTGFLGCSFGLTVPELGLGLAVFVNGMPTDRTQIEDRKRRYSEIAVQSFTEAP